MDLYIGCSLVGNGCGSTLISKYYCRWGKIFPSVTWVTWLCFKLPPPSSLALYGDWAILKFRNMPASASWMLESKVYATMPCCHSQSVVCYCALCQEMSLRLSTFPFFLFLCFFAPPPSLCNIKILMVLLSAGIAHISSRVQLSCVSVHGLLEAVHSGLQFLCTQVLFWLKSFRFLQSRLLFCLNWS